MVEKAEPVEASTFSDRLEFAIVRMAMRGTPVKEGELAERVGVAGGTLSDWKRPEPPRAERVLGLSKALDVDPGWLGFGEASRADAPEGFAAWLAGRRAARHPTPQTLRLTAVERSAAGKRARRRGRSK